MAPIRRYLRITKYSVLECRIYLDNPALAQSWLLNPRNPVLPRVIESVRPLVLPKLREERERSRKRSTKKKGIKDVVVEDDFEVSIFLTETSTRHALLTKHKHFHDTTQTKLTSNSVRLVGASNEAPVDVDATAAELAPAIRVEDSDDEVDPAAALAAIPAVDETAAAGTGSGRRPKRARRSTETEAEGDADRGGKGLGDSDVEIVSGSEREDGEDDDDDDDDGLFVHDGGDGDEDPDGDAGTRPPPSKRRRRGAATAAAEVGYDGAEKDDEKKKLAMDISYEGFSIYGRVLCLVVKRREGSIGVGPQPPLLPAPGRGSGRTSAGAASTKPGGGAAAAAAAGRGQAMMENFIMSTQVPAGADV
ncbi:hypothetical protein GGR53DRAFT_286555 [Hypoxylon sp. FL1150]|nr:hypothetical protein GGR53DRAFT_286555 [Hypoxylon sp. FL1150]